MKTFLVVILLALAIFIGVYISKQKSATTGTPKVTVTMIPDKTNPVVASSVLDLSGQGITKAPMYIFDRTDITELNLSNNKITGSLQAEVRKLQNLTVLNLSNNQFSGLPAEIGQLKNLEVLNLSNNLLTGLPNELGNLSKLKVLDLSGNKYSESDLATIRKSLPSSTVIKTN